MRAIECAILLNPCAMVTGTLPFTGEGEAGRACRSALQAGWLR